MNPSNATIKKWIIQSKDGWRIWIDISPKQIYKWPISRLKKCSTLLIIDKIQIKTLRYYVTHTESESCSVTFDSTTPLIIQSMKFSRPEYWSGWPFHSPGDLPSPGIKPRSPTLQEDSLSAELPGKPQRGRCGCMDWKLNLGLPCGRWEFYHWTTHAPVITHTRMTIIKKDRQQTSVGEDTEKLEPMHS